MLRGLYTAASGMIAQQRKTETLANNLANANTPGFKADQTSVRSFPEMLLMSVGQGTLPNQQRSTIPQLNSLQTSISTGVYVQELTPLLSQGDLFETGMKTDIGLYDINVPQGGTVLYTVQGENGVSYTRNGNLTLDGNGSLVTSNGYYVLDTNGNTITLGNEDFTVNDQGEIIQNGQGVAKLGVAYAADASTLRKIGTDLYESDGQLQNAYNVEGLQFQTVQGFLENSNVNESQTMTDMMTAYRSFEANQKLLQAYDKSLDKAVNEIGRL
ncbi:flagellar basal body rod protein FlgC [Bacillus coahuilensis m2-6]|uniref:Flagellar basal body rod protein FlgC n=1 Tax=Bacillus coahuilensis p1.1.43 TaxID=1150625 RepID=A0A147K498_9BACI|nr:flagellar hook-basal body protein [Bacillus coahuilensis]KUP04137.1 flagellar basal body rod protein FlgC [Bacillus coahuilensis p1.1.43]KUP05119.1 flagellar basal body rod protein FlgC [Bacillus coahuilensis m2-6]